MGSCGMAPKDLWERRYELDVAELTERLHLSNNEMRAFEEERPLGRKKRRWKCTLGQTMEKNVRKILSQVKTTHITALRYIEIVMN